MFGSAAIQAPSSGSPWKSTAHNIATFRHKTCHVAHKRDKACWFTCCAFQATQIWRRGESPVLVKEILTTNNDGRKLQRGVVSGLSQPLTSTPVLSQATGNPVHFVFSRTCPNHNQLSRAPCLTQLPKSFLSSNIKGLQILPSTWLQVIDLHTQEGMFALSTHFGRCLCVMCRA